MNSAIRALLCAAEVLCIAAPLAALAQDYPARRILVVSSANTGSSGDVALRLVTRKMSENLGQQVVVETRPGASSVIAQRAVAGAAPDGYTVLYDGQGGLVTSRYFVKNLPYDSLTDFVPIGILLETVQVLVVHPSVPVKSVRELVEYAKRNPGKLMYASTGVGSPFHLIGESFKMTTGTNLRHIPYNAGNAAVQGTDLVAGRVQIYFPSYASARANLTSGKLRVLATLGSKRYKRLPDVPAISEVLPEFQMNPGWYAFMGPLALPRPIAERLSAESRKALDDSEVSARLDDLGLLPVGSTMDEMTAGIKKAIESTGKITKALGLKPE